MKKKQRIRYTEKDGKLISTEVFSKQGSRYVVYIDLTTKLYLIRNTLSLRKYTGGEGINNLHVLKRHIKKHLEALGCQFEKEKRQRTFGVCPKGWTMEKEIRKRKEKLQTSTNNGEDN